MLSNKYKVAGTLLASGSQLHPRLRKRMPDIEISEECRALIAVEFEIDETARRLPNGNWQIQIDEETWRRLEKVRLCSESISGCIIRVTIITHLKRGLL
jgi:hypothetical protein